MISQSDQHSVVVPGLLSGSSTAFVRSLGKRGIRPIVVSERTNTPAFRSRYCEEKRIVPAPSEDLSGYRDALLELAERSDVRTIVPVREADIYVLSKHRTEFAKHIATPWMPFDAIEAVQDRCQLFDAARAAGVAIPKTRLFDEWDCWDREVVLKSRHSILVADGGTAYPNVEFVRPGVEPDADAVVSRMGHEPMVQGYVPGDEECGFFAVFDRGEPLATFQHRRIRSYTYSGGASVFRESINDPELEAAGLALLSHLDWHGPAMVEFKRDPRTGEFTLMEINPRFWGSLPLAVHAGVDFPYLYYRLAIGDPPTTVPGYETSVGCHRLTGEVSYLSSVVRHDFGYIERPAALDVAYQVIASTLRQRRFDYLSLDDPRPFVQDCVNLAREIGAELAG